MCEYKRSLKPVKNKGMEVKGEQREELFKRSYKFKSLFSFSAFISPQKKKGRLQFPKTFNHPVTNTLGPSRRTHIPYNQSCVSSKNLSSKK
jgi:hypothetical protein